uniref:Kinetochore protein NDC80 n=1 Tax=Lygus hesperus TaxID=30085 RepID=A0A0A9YSG0_LYGHE
MYDSQHFTLRTLQSPTSKDFRNIFLFIVQKIDKNFILSEKQYEDDIRNTLRLLGYPITVHRTTLQSIGSPHSLPALLGILEWLVHMVILMDTTLHSDSSLCTYIRKDYSEFFEEEMSDRCFFEYMSLFYNNWMVRRGEEMQLEPDLLHAIDNNRHQVCI